MHLTVTNRQRRVTFDLDSLRARANTAAPLCLTRRGPGPAVLPGLEEVEITILSDRRIAEVNVKYLGHRGPTDVITFDHGEILISAERAQENARRYESSVPAELSLYIVHGLLHLNGWSDKAPPEAEAMRAAQEEILRKVMTVHPPDACT